MIQLPETVSYSFEYDGLLLGGERPFDPNDLDMVAVRMLQTQEIPGLVPVNVIEINQSYRLSYRLENCRMLSEQWRIEEPTESDILRILLEILKCWKAIDPYLLPRAGVLVHEDYIFWDKRRACPRFIHVPLRTALEQNDFACLESFIMRTLQRVRLEGCGIMRVLQAIKSDVVDSETIGAIIRQSLEEVRTDKRGMQIKEDEPETVEPAKSDKSDLVRQSGGFRLPSPEMEDPTLSVLWDTGSLDTSEEEGGSTGTSKGAAPVDTIRLLAALLICSAADWAIWALVPTMSMLYICIVVQLVLAFGAFLYWRFRIKDRDKSGITLSYETKPMIENRGDMSDVIRTTIELPEEAPLELRTVLLTEPNQTVLLNAPPSPAKERVYLILYHDQGTKEEFPIQEHPCIVGRENPCDLILSHAAVSRRHVQIDYAEDNYMIRDLGSANGTVLNGARMAAYRDYPLQNGDRLQLVHWTIEFRRESLSGLPQSRFRHHEPEHNE